MSEQPDPPAVLDETCGWPVDLGCCDWTEESPSPAVKQRSMNLAVQTLRTLTGYRVGGCSVTVRPCAPRCAVYHGGRVFAPFNPHIGQNGQWVNSCGCSSWGCGCKDLSVVPLPGPVGRVDSVYLDGVELVEGVDFVVMEGNLLRLDGRWPACQDLTVPDDAEGAFAVTYLNAHLPSAGAAYAAGLLACEYAKACQGQTCQLPRGARQVTRRGISIEIPADAFEGGKTGIREVDSFISSWNPHGLAHAPTIVSPDVRPAMRSGWAL